MTPVVLPAEPKWTEVRRGTLYLGLVICIVTFAFFRWVWFPVKVSGDSMVPNYDDGQPTYINRLAYLADSPRRGDVVGFQVGDEFYIKRVIGLPGERIEFHRDVIVVNGQPLQEHYSVRPLLWQLEPVQLGANDYFVMGDNRATSMLGAVPRDKIIGKAIF